MKWHLRQSVFLVLIALLVSSTITGLHHHEDGHPHTDCPVCVAGSSLVQATLDTGSHVSYFPDLAAGPEPQKTHIAFFAFLSVISDRAPPLS